MKKIIIISMGVLCALCTVAQNGPVRIEGRINNAPDTMKLVFLQGDGGSFRSFKYDTVINGRFTVDYVPSEGVELSTWFSIGWMTEKDNKQNGQGQRFIAGEGVTLVEGDGVNIQRWRITNNTVEQMEQNLINRVESKYYDDIREYYKAMNEIRAKITPDTKDSLRKISNEIRQGLDTVLAAQSVDVFEMLSKRSELTQAGLLELSSIVEFGLKYGDYMKPYRERVVEFYGRLTAQQKNSPHGRTIYEILNPRKKFEIGDILPNDILRDTAGIEHTMTEYRGKYLLVDIWDIGCGPCIMAGDELREMQAKYNDKLTIIGVNTNAKSSWLQATKAHNVSWTNLSDGLGLSAGFCGNFNIDGVPHYILADPTGKIIKVAVGYGKGSIEALLAEVLDNK